MVNMGQPMAAAAEPKRRAESDNALLKAKERKTPGKLDYGFNKIDFKPAPHIDKLR